MIRTAYCVALAFLAAAISHPAQADDVAPPRSTKSTLPGVTVVGTRPDDDYRVDTVASIGPMGSEKILDIPYSVSVLPLDLIENSQAVNFKDVSSTCRWWRTRSSKVLTS